MTWNSLRMSLGKGPLVLRPQKKSGVFLLLTCLTNITLDVKLSNINVNQHSVYISINKYQ